MSSDSTDEYNVAELRAFLIRQQRKADSMKVNLIVEDVGRGHVLQTIPCKPDTTTLIHIQCKDGKTWISFGRGLAVIDPTKDSMHVIKLEIFSREV